MSDANGINNLGRIVARGRSPKRGYIYADSPIVLSSRLGR
jgi:hypothetical protein